MTLPEINEIKYHRVRLGLSLREFANKCGLTASWINQVEIGQETKSGGIKDPSYLKMKKIFDMLDNEVDPNPITAEKLCVPLKKFKKISKSKTTMEFCKLGTPILDIYNIMTKYGISQMPVLENGYCLGMITKKTVLDLTLDGNLAKIYVNKKILEQDYSTVNVQAPLNYIRRIMNYFDYALVENEGIIHGILVKDDLINELK